MPGHIDFINNMLAGFGAVNYALLVIAADDGVMPQTREHLSIIKLLGVKNGIIAITKIDKIIRVNKENFCLSFFFKKADLMAITKSSLPVAIFPNIQIT